MIIIRCLFGHQIIFANLYHAIDFESSSILIHANMLVILQLCTFDFLLMHFPHPLCQNISSNQSFFGRVILKNFPFLIAALFLVFVRNCSLVAIWQSIRLYRMPNNLICLSKLKPHIWPICSFNLPKCINLCNILCHYLQPNPTSFTH